MLLKSKSFSNFIRLANSVRNCSQFSVTEKNEPLDFGKYNLRSSLIYEYKLTPKKIQRNRFPRLISPTIAGICFYFEYKFIGTSLIAMSVLFELLMSKVANTFKDSVDTIKYRPEIKSIEYSLIGNSASFIVPLSDLNFNSEFEVREPFAVLRLHDGLNKVSKNLFIGSKACQLQNKEFFKDLITNNFDEVAKFQVFSETADDYN